ncbi:MAG: hypothetical protein RQ751_05180 [Longimicrobiales bacterium]|nr:hypothetical protein [Longimicrobiales bacterium]
MDRPPAERPPPARAAFTAKAGASEPVRLPGRALTLDGEAWWAQELGRVRSGLPGDPGAELVLVGFRRAADAEDAFRTEALLPGAGLDALSDARLEDAARAAGPYRPLSREPPPFFGKAGQQRSGERKPRRGRDRS